MYLENATARTEEPFLPQHVPALPLPPYHITESAARLKYIDDLTLCQTVNLNGLENMPEESERPLNYRDRIRRRTNFDDVEKFCSIQKNV